MNVLPELCYTAEACPVTFILSKSGPFNPEMAISFSRLLHWLALYGCRHYYHVHVSGHSPMDDLEAVIEAANPEVIVPVHTRYPEMFDELHPKVVADIQLGRPYAI